jgi:anthranilate phosphoribosyltransferase
MESFKPYLAKVATGAALTREEARSAFDALLSGEVTPAQAGGFLMALRVRGEALDELVGAASAMRGRMLRVEAPRGRSTSSAPAATIRAATTSRRSPR